MSTGKKMNHYTTKAATTVAYSEKKKLPQNTVDLYMQQTSSSARNANENVKILESE